nr:MAG TPA: hypothetical protein [Caudoviricetes sp.]
MLNILYGYFYFLSIKNRPMLPTPDGIATYHA